MTTKIRRAGAWLWTEILTIKRDLTGLPHSSEFGLSCIKIGYFFLGASVMPFLQFLNNLPDSWGARFMIAAPWCIIVSVFFVLSYYWRRWTFPARLDD